MLIGNEHNEVASMSLDVTLFDQLQQMRNLMKREWQSKFRGTTWKSWCADARKGMSPTIKQHIMDIMMIKERLANVNERFRFCSMSDKLWSMLQRARQTHIDKQKHTFFVKQLDKLKKAAKSKRAAENRKLRKTDDNELSELDDEELDDELAKDVDLKLFKLQEVLTRGLVRVLGKVTCADAIIERCFLRLIEDPTMPWLVSEERAKKVRVIS